MKKNIKKTLWISFLVLLAAGAGLTAWSLQKTESTFLWRNGLSGLTVKQMVEKLERIDTERGDFSASITSKKLILSDAVSSYDFDLPEDEFYLSIAPYETRTHTCSIHSLVSCSGEKVKQAFYVSVEDRDNESVILEGTYETSVKGFLGLWLPRERNATITVTWQDLSAQGDISTFEGNPTCLTTLHLM